MSSFTGVVGLLLAAYWLWAINRPAHDRPHIVRGPGSVVLPVLASVLLYFGWR